MTDTAIAASTDIPEGAKDLSAARAIRIWLYAMCLLLAAMVAVGGATRLTDSGLSITEWKPVTGAVPPLSDAAWAEEFEKYQKIPEFERVNSWMTVDDFKSIYWWEWAHRFLGRLIGIAFLIPMLFFLITKQATGALAWKLGGLFVLGGMQGALGWFMVASGLAGSDRIDVSQFRLAAHFGLAVVIFGAILWVALGLRPTKGLSVSRPLKLGAWALVAGVFAQLILGAFVAGLRAGRTYNTWPLMDGKFVPDGYFGAEPKFVDLFDRIAAVQFNHRIGAYLLLAGAVAYWWSARGTAIEMRARVLLGAIVAQALLGIWTVLAAAPLSLGLAHQLLALGILSIAVWNLRACYSPPRSISGGGSGFTSNRSSMVTSSSDGASTSTENAGERGSSVS